MKKESDDCKLKQCINCKEDILPEASVCKHCGTYQQSLLAQLHLYLPYISTAIAVLALLISLWPNIVSTLEPKRAEVRYELIGIKEDKLLMFVANNGNRTTVIKGANVFHEVSTNGKEINACETRYIPMESLVVIKPNEQKVVYSERFQGLPTFVDEPKGIFTPLEINQENGFVDKWFNETLEALSRKYAKYEKQCTLSLVTVAEKTVIKPESLSFTCVPDLLLSPYQNVAKMPALTKTSR